MDRKTIQHKLKPILNPIGLFALISIFVLPALAFVNLSPKVSSQLKVLGTESKPEIGVVLVGGVHDIFDDERIAFPSDNSYNYASQLIKHDKGRYSKPIIEITNFSDSIQKIVVSGNTQNNTNSDIYVGIGDSTYMIQDQGNQLYSKEIPLEGSSKNIVYLIIDSKTQLRFNDSIVLDIVKK